jgi:type VI secretion system protein ImpA
MPDLPEIVDLSSLLAPIAGTASAAGADLREDSSATSLYIRLRDARSEARASERAMEDEDETSMTPPAQWRTIRELATEAICARTKDLEIAVWLTEALLRIDGLRGFGGGVKLMNGLVEQYWDDLFPLPDEEGLETRLAALASLNGRSGDGTLIQPLRRLALFDRPDGAPLQFWQYEQSVSLAGIVDSARRQQRIDAGVIPYEVVEAEAQIAGSASLAALSRDAAAAAQAWRALGDALETRAGADAPPTSRVRELLDQIASVAARFVGPTATDGATAQPGSGAAPAEAGEIAAAPAAPEPMPGSINSRADALRSLAAIAAYFRRTEPLSPLAYTLEEVVRRAAMTWPQLLEEIIPDRSARALVLNSLGIRPPPE